jgi:hypothetical protein
MRYMKQAGYRGWGISNSAAYNEAAKREQERALNTLLKKSLAEDKKDGPDQQ